MGVAVWDTELVGVYNGDYFRDGMITLFLDCSIVPKNLLNLVPGTTKFSLYL